MFSGVMSAPLGYFISWTTKGAWLPGDPRGWVRKGVAGIQTYDAQLHRVATLGMKHDFVVLNQEQRDLVEQTIRDHCEHRGWRLHAVNVRTNHVHMVVTVADVRPETVMEQCKAWCSRRLNEHARAQKRESPGKWWTPHGSTKWINDQAYLENAIRYVSHRQ